MRDIILEPVYNIGDRVYYNLPEGPVGIVTDITYRASSDIVWYEVTFDVGSGAIACQDFELTKEKQII